MGEKMLVRSCDASSRSSPTSMPGRHKYQTHPIVSSWTMRDSSPCIAGESFPSSSLVSTAARRDWFVVCMYSRSWMRVAGGN